MEKEGMNLSEKGGFLVAMKLDIYKKIKKKSDIVI